RTTRGRRRRNAGGSLETFSMNKETTMNRTDDMIRRALAAEELPRPDELPLTEQIFETFRGRNRWIAIYVWIYTLVFAALTAYSIYRFANAADEIQTFSWGIGI